MLSPSDTAIVFLLALLLFGPEQLPKIARQLGEVMRHMQSTTHAFMNEMERAARVNETTYTDVVPVNPEPIDAALVDGAEVDGAEHAVKTDSAEHEVKADMAGQVKANMPDHEIKAEAPEEPPSDSRT